MSARAEAPSSAPPPPSTTVPFRDWLAVWGGILGAFMAILDIQITNSSLKDIQGSLGASLDEGSWISTGYLIAEIVVIPLTGWLCGVFSLRRYLLVNASLFLVFSMACGACTSLSSMIILRACQGFTGGVLIPTAFTIVITKLPAAKRSIGAALFGITATFAPAIGPTIGGWLTDTFSWRFIFYMNLIPGLLLIAIISYSLDRAPMHLERLKQGDWFGIATMAMGLGSLEYVLEEGQRKDWLGSDLIFHLTLVAGVCLTIFLLLQFFKKQPLLNLRLLGVHGFGAACAMNLFTGLGLYGSIYILPVYLGQIQGYNAMQIGEVVMWMGLPQFLVLPFVPKLMKHIDPRWLIAFGLSLFAISCLMNAGLSPLTAADQLRWSQLVRALGQPFIMAPLGTIATLNIKGSDAPAASSLFNIMRNMGGSIGIAILSTFSSRRETYHFSIIAEHVTHNNITGQTWLQTLQQYVFNPHGFTGADAHMRALAELVGTVRAQAYVEAYSDCFFIMAVALTLCIPLAFLLASPHKQKRQRLNAATAPA